MCLENPSSRNILCDFEKLSHFELCKQGSKFSLELNVQKKTG